MAGGLKLLAEVRLALTIAFYLKYAYVLSAIGAPAMLCVTAVDIAVHEWATPLTIAIIGFMLLAIGLVFRTNTAVCILPGK